MKLRHKELTSGRTLVPRAPGQTLMIDADDTLWENSIYFERAIEQFIDFLSHPELSPEEVRDSFNQTEHARVQVHGYGSASFRDSMLVCFEHLTGAPCNRAQTDALHQFARTVYDHRIDLLDGVAETLPALAERHRLILVTKGDRQEQQSKLQRSGLHAFFHGTEVLPEKHADAYHLLRERYGCHAPATWMIGNSPKSDINPALAAGLNAIHIPHTSTWVLEHEPLAPPPQGRDLLVLANFRELGEMF